MKEEFFNIIKPFLDNENFLKSQSSIHHGVIKLDHSLKVSYYSYKIGKILNLNCNNIAIGGLLHDFFFSNTKGKSISKEGVKSLKNHHFVSLHNSINNFELNDMEKDIIFKHMFPVILTIPKYKESLLVALIDKLVGSIEFFSKFRKLFTYKVLAKGFPAFLILFSLK